MELLPWKSCWWINGIPTLNIQPGVLEQLKPRWSHSRVISSPERGDDCFHFTLGLISGHFSYLLTCFYIFIFLPPWTTVPQFIRIYYMCCLPHIFNNFFFFFCPCLGLHFSILMSCLLPWRSLVPQILLSHVCFPPPVVPLLSAAPDLCFSAFYLCIAVIKKPLSHRMTCVTIKLCL